MLSLALTEERRQTEWETIQTVAQNNNFPNTHRARLKTKKQQKNHIRTTKEKKKKKMGNIHIPQPKSQKAYQSP
jgi:hypothetical protein